MDPIPCSWWVPTGVVWREVARMCPSGHETSVVMAAIKLDNPYADEAGVDWASAPWPPLCVRCGYVFRDSSDDTSQWSSTAVEMRCPATKEVVHSGRDLPPGALWEDPHYKRTGPDGRHIVCVLPNGHGWHIDARASNCGNPADDEHRCWVRHGDVTRPETVHVDKDGTTCSAGEGSIESGDWHGFLHHGHLVE